MGPNTNNLKLKNLKLYILKIIFVNTGFIEVKMFDIFPKKNLSLFNNPIYTKVSMGHYVIY